MRHFSGCFESVFLLAQGYIATVVGKMIELSFIYYKISLMVYRINVSVKVNTQGHEKNIQGLNIQK